MKEKVFQQGLDVIEVNSFIYHISEWEEDETESPSRFDINIKINGKTPKELFGDVADFCFSPWEFHASIGTEKNNTSHPPRKAFSIFTCICGDDGCDGWDEGISVEKDKETITWLIKEKLNKPTKLIFKFSDYRNFDLKLRKDIEELAKKKQNILFNRASGIRMNYLLEIYEIHR